MTNRGSLKTTAKGLIFVFNGINTVFPFGMAVILAGAYIMGGWEQASAEHYLEHYSLFPIQHFFLILFSLIAICLFICIFCRTLSGLQTICNKKYCIRILTFFILFFISCILRLALVYTFKEYIQPFSDFQRIWDMAHGNIAEHIDYYTLFPAYMNFAVFERDFIRIFGDQYIRLIYFNCTVSSITASLIYLMCNVVFANERLAILAGMLYAFMPSNIVYCAVSTPEFLAVFANISGSICLLKIFEQTGFAQVIFAGLGGFFLGLGSAYKPFGIIIMIAFLLSFAAQGIMHSRKRKCRMFLIILIILGCYKGASTGILQNTENEFQTDLDYAVSYPHYFLIGLNTEGEGQIHLGSLSRKYYSEYLNNGHNVEAAGQYAAEVLKKDWHDHPDAVIPNFFRKMIWAFQDDVAPFGYWKNNLGIVPDTVVEKIIHKLVSEYMSSLSQIYYLLLMIFAAAACARSLYEMINYKKEFLMLICFGYFCLMFFSEAQSRYKCLIMPYVCILSAVSFQAFLNKLSMKGKGDEQSTGNRRGWFYWKASC